MFQQVSLTFQWLELVQISIQNQFLANRKEITMAGLYQGFSTSSLLIFRDG